MCMRLCTCVRVESVCARACVCACLCLEVDVYAFVHLA